MLGSLLREDYAGSGEHQGGECRNRLTGNAEPIAKIVVKGKPEFPASLHEAEHRIARHTSISADTIQGETDPNI